DRNRCRYRIIALRRFAAPLNLDRIATCSICRATGDGHCGEYVESALVGKLARILNLTHHVIGRESHNRDSYFWISEIFAAEFLGECLFELPLCEALRFYGSRERQRDLTTLIDVVLTAELVFPEHINANFVPRLKRWGRRRGRGQRLLLRFTD